MGGEMKNVLLVDRFPEAMVREMTEMSATVQYRPEWKRPEILAALSEVDILVMNSKTQVDRELLDAAPKLRLLCRAGVGMDHFDLPLLAERGIRVVNTPGANALPVGEQAVGMLLGMLHRIPWADREVQTGKWLREANRGRELGALTVGIIGHGATGSAFSRCLSGFGCRILAYDKYKSDFGNDHVTEASMEQLFEEADVLSLHIPLTEETHSLANTAFFDRFHKSLWFLNLARGPIAPMADLAEAIEKGQVIAAGLDVLENEKLHTFSPAQQSAFDRLVATEKVIFTPHIGGWSHESLKRINDWILREVRAELGN